MVEVTQDEWAACVLHTNQDVLTKQSVEQRVGCAPAGDAGFGGGRKDGGAFPAINVSWDDAQAYVRWLNWMLTGDVED